MCISQISNKEMAEYIAKQTLKNHLVYSIVLLYKVVKNSIYDLSVVLKSVQIPNT